MYKSSCCVCPTGDRAEGAEAALEAGLKKLTLTAAHADARQDDNPCNPDNPEELLPTPATPTVHVLDSL